MSARSLRVSVPDTTWLETFGHIENVEMVVWDVESAQPDGYLDLVLLPYGLVVEPLRNFDPTRLGLIQSQALGYDGVGDALPAGSVYAKAVGVHEGNVAELAVALILASQRRLDVFARQQVDGGWNRVWAPGLVDRTVMLLGYGGIGREIFNRLQGFGCSVLRVGRRSKTDAAGRIHSVGAVPGLLPEVDVVVIALPLDPSTVGLVGQDFMKALPDGALVVNVSRAGIVDHAALADEGGRVRYTTDVMEVEPLPADHPFRSDESVFFTPHVGGRSLAQRPRVERLVRHQIASLLKDRPPVNVVFGDWRPRR